MEKLIFIKEPLGSTLYVRPSDIICVRSYEKMDNYMVKIYINGLQEPSTIKFDNDEDRAVFIKDILENLA